MVNFKSQEFCNVAYWWFTKYNLMFLCAGTENNETRAVTVNKAWTWRVTSELKCLCEKTFINTFGTEKVKKNKNNKTKYFIEGNFCSLLVAGFLVFSYHFLSDLWPLGRRYLCSNEKATKWPASMITPGKTERQIQRTTQLIADN